MPNNANSIDLPNKVLSEEEEENALITSSSLSPQQQRCTIHKSFCPTIIKCYIGGDIQQHTD
jgi:hypothetical protein